MSFIVHYKKSALLHSIFLIFILILMVLISSSCTKQEDNTLVIAKQYGIAYAPLQIMQEKIFMMPSRGFSKCRMGTAGQYNRHT